MKKNSILIVAMMAVLMSSCQHDTFGDLFVKRKSVTFHVQSEHNQPLKDVCLMTVERDAFDNDPIVGRTNYAYTDENGFVTVNAAFNEEPGYSRLGERTTSFSFSADGYTAYDTVFNYWEDTVDIILYRQ